MDTKNYFKKVIWAVDPFSEGKKLQFATFKALAKLTEGTAAEIEPVAVLSPDQLKVPASAFQGQDKEYRLEAESIIESWAKTLKNSRLIRPTFLVQNQYAGRQSVEVLLKYAKDSGASLIGIGTHNKKGFERFFVGSFAETLILKSDVPLLVVNPKSPPLSKLSNILFPTDFSDASHETFLTLLPIAKALKAKVTLFYKFEYIDPQTLQLMELTKSYGRFLKAEVLNREQMASEWKEEAIKFGVKIDTLLDKKPTFVPDGILKAAKMTKANLIAMASQSGAVSSVLIGSVARQIVRMATIPVWVIHPKQASKGAQKGVERDTGPRLRSVN